MNCSIDIGVTGGMISYVAQTLGLVYKLWDVALPLLGRRLN